MEFYTKEEDPELFLLFLQELVDKELWLSVF